MTMIMNNAQEEEEELEIPTAYRFCPTDKELITFYLRRKVDGQPLPRFTPIVEKKLYGSDQPSPWEIFRGITRTSTSADEDFDFYFFTLVKKKFGKGKTIERKIATGTWRIQNNNPVYDNNGDEDSTEKKKKMKKKKKKIKSSSSGLTTLGHLKTLNYIQGSIEEQEKQQQGCSLIMHEYSLIEYPKHQTENWVLCRLKMGMPSTTPKRPIGMEENDQLCEPPNKRSKSSSPSSVSSVTAAATSTCEHGEGLLLQQSQSCSDNIDDHLWDTSLDYEACQAILDDDVYASLLNQLPDPKLCATSNATTTTTSTWSSNLIQSDVLPDMPQPIQEPPSQYQLSGTTSCPSACPTGTQSAISVPISEVSDMWLPIQEPPSHQPQLEYEKFPEYLAEQDGYTLDDIWDDSFSY